ncbi:MAG TPA: DEAD/DEAH box helicase [Gemmatimonadaceae bacterium]|nr:DEAD/DEAH box helicase [Gemmatimonadaceae bacterium]
MVTKKNGERSTGQFGKIELSTQVMRGVDDMGFEEPTPIQAQAIPHLLAGRNVVAQALTGTGKTAAFGIPVVERIEVKRNVPQAVILTPTSELAVQVSEQLSLIGRHRGVRLVPIYGGQPIDRQLRALHHGVHVIVATPGRLMDHINRGSVDLKHVTMLVLDEADQMLAMGFQEDVEYIMSHLPKERVTALFSATMPRPITDIVGRYMRDHEMLRLSKPKEMTVPEIEQVFYQVPYPRKLDALCRVLDARRADRVLTFCATKRTVDMVVEGLQGRGYLAEGLHGDISQVLRQKVLNSFRDGRTEVLVATDVAARGLDIVDVAVVVNFDIPPDPEYYVHRIGRTGRAGAVGEAITFVNPHEMRELKAIERITGARITRGEVPSEAEGGEREAEQLLKRLREALAGTGWNRYRAVVDELVEEHDALDVAAAALALTAGNRRKAAPSAPTPTETDRPRGSYGSPRQNRDATLRGGRGPGWTPTGRKRKGPPTGRPRR